MFTLIYFALTTHNLCYVYVWSFRDPRPSHVICLFWCVSVDRHEYMHLDGGIQMERKSLNLILKTNNMERAMFLCYTALGSRNTLAENACARLYLHCGVRGQSSAFCQRSLKVNSVRRSFMTLLRTVLMSHTLRRRGRSIGT